MSSTDPSIAQAHRDGRVRQIWLISTLQGENFVQVTLTEDIEAKDIKSKPTLELLTALSRNLESLTPGDHLMPVFIRNHNQLLTWPSTSAATESCPQFKITDTTLEEVMQTQTLYKAGNGEAWTEMNPEEKINEHAKDKGWI